MAKAKPKDDDLHFASRSDRVSIKLARTERTMRMYSLSRTEMGSLSLMNDLQSGCFSMATLFFSVWLPDPKKDLPYLVLAVAFVIAAFITRYRSNQVWHTIVEETADLEAPTQANTWAANL